MENKSDAVLTDDDVVFLEDIDYIEIDEKQVEIDNVIADAVRQNLNQDFNQPDLLKDKMFVNKLEKEVKQKINLKLYNEKNKDQLYEVASSVTAYLLKQKYKLKVDESRVRPKLRNVKEGIFATEDLRTSALPSSTSVKSLILPNQSGGFGLL